MFSPGCDVYSSEPVVEPGWDGLMLLSSVGRLSRHRVRYGFADVRFYQRVIYCTTSSFSPVHFTGMTCSSVSQCAL